MAEGVNDWLASVLKPKQSKPILPNCENPNIGMGRLVTLNNPLTLKETITNIKQHIGVPYLRVAVANGKDLSRID